MAGRDYDHGDDVDPDCGVDERMILKDMTLTIHAVNPGWDYDHDD